MSQRKLIVGNWKMNGLSAQMVELMALIERLDDVAANKVKVVVCPPATLLAYAGDVLEDTQIDFGAQDCHAKASGAHTGDLSAVMFADMGAKYVIIGHSERRANHGESNDAVRAKAMAACEAGLMAIICVGESEAQRDAGQAECIVLDQISGSLPNECAPQHICIAYEPVWAIGTGRTPSVEDVRAMHLSIRGALRARFGVQAGDGVAVLYGGSVNGKNAAVLLAVENVDGALVGGASLTADSFMEIISTQL